MLTIETGVPLSTLSVTVGGRASDGSGVISPPRTPPISRVNTSPTRCTNFRGYLISTSCVDLKKSFP